MGGGSNNGFARTMKYWIYFDILQIIPATLKLVRGNSMRTEDIGVDREVTVGCHVSKKSLVVTRYYTVS